VQETQTITFPVALHRGERQAILLAEALRADVLLIEIGRTIAPSRNLPLSGTLGVLERADTLGCVSDSNRFSNDERRAGSFSRRPWSNSF
jgi:predicted nucleic acid-binding protein